MATLYIFKRKNAKGKTDIMATPYIFKHKNAKGGTDIMAPPFTFLQVKRTIPAPYCRAVTSTGAPLPTRRAVPKVHR